MKISVIRGNNNHLPSYHNQKLQKAVIRIFNLEYKFDRMTAERSIRNMVHFVLKKFHFDKIDKICNTLWVFSAILK